MVLTSHTLPPLATISNWNSLERELIQEFILVLHQRFVSGGDFLF